MSGLTFSEGKFRITVNRLGPSIYRIRRSHPLLHRAPWKREWQSGTKADHRLNASEQKELQTRMEKRQIKEMMTMYSRLVQKCFDNCVNDFTTKSLHSKEEGCTMRCVDKYLKGQERLGQRFQENNAAMMQSGQMPGK